MTESEENILLLLQRISCQLFQKDYSIEDNNRSSMMEKIHSHNLDLHTALKEFIIAQESLSFIASDYQLRLKAADVWKSQKEIFIQVLQSKSAELMAIAKKLDLNIETEMNHILIISE